MVRSIENLVVLIAMAGATTALAGDGVRYSSIDAIHSRPQMEDSIATVQATITLNGSPSYIQDSTGGAELDDLSTQGLRIGDEILVSGQPIDTESGLVFRHSRVELLWHGSPVPPLSVTADDAALGKFANLLIEVNGRLAGMERRNGETWLRLESSHQVFLARLNSDRGGSLLPPLEDGSMVRLRGVCSLAPKDTRYQGGFAVLLRSAEDVALISGPPWWSFKHLVEIGILIAGLIIAGHISLIQMLKARFSAIMAERARLGHELHDTLAQSFAGLAFQIQAARKIAPQTNNRLAQHLDVALDMVRHSHAEAHRSIMMLRPQDLAQGADLPAAIRSALEQSTTGCKLKTQFTIHGVVGRLPLMVTDTLYRIAQEAIANSLRHGHPGTLNVDLEYKIASVCLSVADDGVGFEVKGTQSSGFGLAGMRERVRALRGDFSVTSEPASGTQVRAEISLRHDAGARFLAFFSEMRSRYWERLQKILQNSKSESS
jgi:signal transduction histidine kinase